MFVPVVFYGHCGLLADLQKKSAADNANKHLIGPYWYSVNQADKNVNLVVMHK